MKSLILRMKETADHTNSLGITKEFMDSSAEEEAQAIAALDIKEHSKNNTFLYAAYTKEGAFLNAIVVTGGKKVWGCHTEEAYKKTLSTIS